MLEVTQIYGVAEVMANLRSYADESRQAVEATCRGDIAPAIESYMKGNAPWRDQTGNARRGLRASTVYDRSTVTLLLSHSVDYGIYLELARQGQYAIIGPTLRQFGGEFTERIARGIGWKAG